MSSTRWHRIRFKFDPDFPLDPAFARRVLPVYVRDLNRVLGRNTPRQFVFDPQTDIEVDRYDWPPWTDFSPGTGFEYWVCVLPSDRDRSHGGYQLTDPGGASVAGGLRWARLHDPDAPDLDGADYTEQLHVLLHEFAHGCGAGRGEYYNLWRVRDRTGIEPAADIDGSDPDDAFWGAREAMLKDPLTTNLWGHPRFGFRTRLDWWFAHTLFSPLTARILSGFYRSLRPPPLPDLSAVTVQVWDAHGPAEGARVRAWHWSQHDPEGRLLIDTVTGPDGRATFRWADDLDHTPYTETLRLIKVHRAGAVPVVGYITVYDCQAVALEGITQPVLHARLVSAGASTEIPAFRIEAIAPGRVRVEPALPGVLYTLQWQHGEGWIDGPSARATQPGPIELVDEGAGLLPARLYRVAAGG